MCHYQQCQQSFWVIINNICTAVRTVCVSVRATVYFVLYTDKPSAFWNVYCSAASYLHTELPLNLFLETFASSLFSCQSKCGQYQVTLYIRFYLKEVLLSVLFCFTNKWQVKALFLCITGVFLISVSMHPLSLRSLLWQLRITPHTWDSACRQTAALFFIILTAVVSDFTSYHTFSVLFPFFKHFLSFLSISVISSFTFIST